jgi:hypothetical protein
MNTKIPGLAILIVLGIIAGAFVGCGIGALVGSPSAGTGWGCLGGAVAAGVYYYLMRPKAIK